LRCAGEEVRADFACELDSALFSMPDGWCSIGLREGGVRSPILKDGRLLACSSWFRQSLNLPGVSDSLRVAIVMHIFDKMIDFSSTLWSMLCDVSARFCFTTLEVVDFISLPRSCLSISRLLGHRKAMVAWLPSQLMHFLKLDLQSW